MKKKTTQEKTIDNLLMENTSLQLDNNNMTNMSFIFGGVALVSVIGIIALALANDELTQKVRRYARIEEMQHKNESFRMACESIGGVLHFRRVCVKNRVGLYTLEEINQARLHFELGDNK